jgi:hypothetical protein
VWRNVRVVAILSSTAECPPTSGKPFIAHLVPQNPAIYGLGTVVEARGTPSILPGETGQSRVYRSAVRNRLRKSRGRSRGSCLNRAGRRQCLS